MELGYWRYNFYGTEYLAWDAQELHTQLDECEQMRGKYPQLFVGDIGRTTWEEHRQLEALGRPNHGAM
jgi:hypothetical protein